MNPARLRSVCANQNCAPPRPPAPESLPSWVLTHVMNDPTITRAVAAPRRLRPGWIGCRVVVRVDAPVSPLLLMFRR